MKNAASWRLVEDGSRGVNRKILFESQGPDPQAFTEAQLGATIRVLRMQSQDTTQYEEGLKALRAAALLDIA